MATEYKIDFIGAWEDPDKIPAPEVSREGFVTFAARVARIGNQTYLNKDGTIRIDNRPESAVSNKDSLRSFANKPVTLVHPEEKAVLPANFRKTNTVGFTHSDVDYDKGFVRVRITLADEEAIQAILTGSHRQFSAGYLADTKPIPGVWQGQPYTHQQDNIYVNHIALVPQARGGDLLVPYMDGICLPSHSRTLNDSAESDSKELEKYPVFIQLNDAKNDLEIPRDKPIEIIPAPIKTPENNPKNDSIPMSSINIDGSDFAVSETAALAINSKIKNDAAEIAKLQSSVKEAQTKLQEVQTKLDSTQGASIAQVATIEQLNTQIADLQKQINDAANPELLQKIINARVSLEKEASGYVADALTGLSDRDIKLKVIAKIYNGKVNLDGATDEMVNGAYLAAVASTQPNAPTTATKSRQITQDAKNQPVNDADDEDDETIYKRQIEKLKANSTTPLAGSLDNYNRR